ncbi:MAG: peptidyl-prolyl cis-trans isomerase [Lachnospiraceae bacterium]|nr:peptidyl-prolyl cis-trans isomerase [Lachnospiraceae bacterium]
MTRKRLAGGLLAVLTAASLLITGCSSSVNPSATVATMGETKVAMGVANFMLRMQQANYDTYYKSYFGDDMWNKKTGESEETMSESVKKSVIDTLKEMYVLDAHKDEYKVTITEEEMNTIKETAKKFMEKNGSALKGYAATREEDVVEALRLYTVQAKMSKAIKAGADQNVSDADAAQRTFSYARFNIKTKTDASGAEANMTEDEITKVRTDVKELLAKVKAGGDFETLAKEVNGTVTTYSYGKDETAMDKEVIEAADKLKEGEYSDVVETEKFLYVLRLDSKYDKEATENKKKSIISEREDELYKSVVDPWKEGFEFTVDEGEWSKVKFDRTMSIVSDKK